VYVDALLHVCDTCYMGALISESCCGLTNVRNLPVIQSAWVPGFNWQCVNF